MCPRATLRSTGGAAGSARPSCTGDPGRGTGDVTDLGHGHRGQHRPEPGQRPDRVVAPGGASRSAITASSRPDLSGEPAGQLPQRGDLPGVEGWGSCSPSSHADPQVPNRSEQVTGMPSLASTACTCALPEDRSRTSRSGTVSSRSSRTSASDLHLGQPAHPEQVGQVPGVFLVFSVRTHPSLADKAHPQVKGHLMATSPFSAGDDKQQRGEGRRVV